MAVVHSICVIWKDYLTGVPFVQRCDTRSLKYLEEMKFSIAKLFRWSIKLSSYTFRIDHIEGEKNHTDYGSHYIDLEDDCEDNGVVFQNYRKENPFESERTINVEMEMMPL